MPGSTPRISVLVSAEDHSPLPEKFIGALFSQTAPGESFEVIFIDGRRREIFEQVLARYRAHHPQGPHFQYEVIPGYHRARHHNRAMGIARGSLLLFLGDDFIPSPTLVAAHLALHQQEPAETVVGIGSSFLLQPGKDSLYQTLEKSGGLFGSKFSPDMTSVSPDFFYVGNASVKKSLMNKCGTFDEDFPFDCWDDYEMGLRLGREGMRARYVPDATTEHDHRFSVAERCRAMRRLGYSAAVHHSKFPSVDAPWNKWLRHGALAGRIRAWRYRLRYALRGDPRHLDRYHKLLFNSHFAQGYHAQRRGLPSTHRSFHGH